MLSLRQNQIKEMGRMNKFTPAFKAKVAIEAIKEVLYSHTIKNQCQSFNVNKPFHKAHCEISEDLCAKKTN